MGTGACKCTGMGMKYYKLAHGWGYQMPQDVI